MTEKHYIKITNYIRGKEKLNNILISLCKNTPKLIIVIYILWIGILLINRDKKLYPFIFVPAINLILISIFRKILNRKRPYENYSYRPIGKYKRGKGESFPSRHTSSGVIIAMACYYVNPVLGGIMWILAFIVGITRILCGLHYPSDVLGGAAISIIFGILGF